MKPNRAEARALKALEEAWAGKLPIDPVAVAEAHGAIVTEDELSDNISGLVHRDDGAPVIVVNESHHERRRRFTVAHELGHMLLHDDRFIVDKTARVHWRDERASQAIYREEIEANAFAAELLMPRHHVVEQVGRALRKDKSLSEEGLAATLAERFKVSEQAMGYRLVNLGFVSSF